MLSSGRQSASPGRSTRKASLAGCLALLAAASSGASAFSFVPVATAPMTLNSFPSLVHRGMSAARMSAAEEPEKHVGGGDGGGTTLAVAVAGGGSGGLGSKAVVASIDAAVDPGQGGATKVAAGTRKSDNSPARASLGTWWTAGLPKWMHLVRRRMITKEDWLHLHAASGAIFLVGGSLYMLYIILMELAGIPQMDTTSALPFCILGAGLMNTLTSIPMANTRSWILNGVCVPVIQLWFPWYVSGVYPTSFAPADPWLAAASLTVLVICWVEAEETYQAEKRAREIVEQSARGRGKPSGKVTMRAGDEEQGDAVNRFGNLAALIFNAPHLYATLVGGGWVDRLAEAYPAEHVLLFHAYFAIATSTSVAFLAPTLYQRRLVSAEEMTAMQLLTAAPVLMSMLDQWVLGSAVTDNPIEIYLGFLH